MKKIVLIIGILCLMYDNVYAYKPIFSSLRDINSDIQNADEHPPIDNTTWKNPDYSTFLKKREPTWLDELFFKMHIKSWPLWHVRAFKDLLLKTVEFRENEGYQGRFVLKMKPEPGSIFIIWGGLHGAYHSLVRALNELQLWGVITDDLRIVKSNYYFIFNGSVVDHSAYSLEALTIIMQLMNNNPGRVFYIRGLHEDQGYWKNFSLNRDLLLRGRRISTETVPLEGEIQRFFDTLPLALYLVGSDDDTKNLDVIRISYWGRDHKELIESQLGGFLNEVEIEPQIFKLNNKTPDAEKVVNIRSIVKGDPHVNTYRPTVGLSQLEADRGATAWTVFSAPTDPYRYLQDFYYDTFAILEIAKTFSDSTISVYDQDIRELFGFKKGATYNLMTGLKKLDEVEKGGSEEFLELKKRLKIAQDEIDHLVKTCDLRQTLADIIRIQEEEKRMISQDVIVGLNVDLSEGAQGFGHHVRDGVEAVFSEINQKGGVDNKRLKLIIYDDSETSSGTRANVKSFLSNYASGILLSPVGSGPLLSYFDLIKEHKVLVLLPVAGFSIVRKSHLKYIVLFRPSHKQELEATTNYIFTNFGIKKIATVYLNNEIGEGLLFELEQALAKNGITELIKIPFNKDEPDVSKQIEILKKENPDEICFIAFPSITQKIIEGLGTEFFLNKKLYGWSDLSQKSFKNFIKNKGVNFLFVNVAPDPRVANLPIVKEFQEAIAKFNIDSDVFTLEGYINASIFVYLLKQITGLVTQESLIAAAEKMSNVDLGGLLLNFDPNTRQLSHTLWLEPGPGEWIKVATD